MKTRMASIAIFLAAAIILAGCIQTGDSSQTPCYFIAIHNEPSNIPGGEVRIATNYQALKRMVAKADEYDIKLTLMFSAQWADYIAQSPEMLAEVERWKAKGHEIAGHHHGLDHGNWDGYSNYSKEYALSYRTNKTGRAEPYRGTFGDYISALEKINPEIKSGCMNDEGDKKELPDAIIHDTCSGFANYGQPGTRTSDRDAEKGVNDFVTVSVYNSIERKWLTHFQITTAEREDEAEKLFLTLNSSQVYGAVTHSAMGEQEEQFYEFLEFLHSKDPEGKMSRTVSEIIDEGILPEKQISAEQLTAPRPQGGNQNGKPGTGNKLCGDGVCDDFEKSNPYACPGDCGSSQSNLSAFQTCVQLNGTVCSVSQTCSNYWITASDSARCCSETCKSDEINETLDLLYSFYAGFDAMSVAENEIDEIFMVASEDLDLNYLKISVNWDKIEPKQGIYNWSKMDRIMDAASKYNLSVILFSHQQGTPLWAAKEPVLNISDCKKGGTIISKDPEFYADYIYQIVKRYHDKGVIKYIELENEPNAGCLWPDTGVYLAEMDNAVYEKIKSSYPDTNVCSASFHQPLGLGEADIKEENEYTEDFLKEYLSNLKATDCFSIHDYGYTGLTQTNNYTFSTQYDLEQNYREILDAYDMGGAPIIFMECAYPVQFFKNDYNFAAAYLVQGYVLSHAKGIVKGRMCQAISKGILGRQGLEDYPIMDISTGEHYAGYYAFRTLRSIMLNYPHYAEHVKGEVNDAAYWIEKFEDEKGNALYIAFTPILYEHGSPEQKPAMQKATINIGIGKAAAIIQMKGEKSTASADNSGNILLDVGAEPVFIEVQ